MIGNKYRSVFAADADLCLHELLCCICKCRGASASAEAASASAEAASARTLPYLQVQRRICKYRGCICKYRGCICKYRSVFVNVTCQQINTDLYLQQTQICACMNFCVVSASAEAASASTEAASASTAAVTARMVAALLLSRVHVLKIIWSTAPAHADNNNAFLFFQHSSSTQDVLL